MILALDTGNTHIHIGVFTRGRLRGTWKLSTDVRRTADEYALLLSLLTGDAAHLEGAIISSVVPRMLETLSEAIEKVSHVRPMILDHKTEIGLKNGYRHPQEVGTDRLASAVGGCLLHGSPLLILDYGTAITLNYVAQPGAGDDKPVYMGGAIMPGIELAAEALARGTAKLPPINLDEPAEVIGRTTIESIRSGLVHGYLGAVRALVDRFKEEIGEDVKVIATGGAAERFRDHLTFVEAIEPDLTLFGLRQIYGLNHNCPLPKP